MRKKRVMALLFLFIGCSNDHSWLDLSTLFKSGTAIAKQTSIEISEFKNGVLSIGGSCRQEGEILLILPASLRDQRIIGSPKCKNGKFQVFTSTYGRPPCEIMVESGGG